MDDRSRVSVPASTDTRPHGSYRSGCELDRDEMDRRIDARFDAWMANGLVDEVRSLPRPLSRTAAQALGYRELLGHLDGECDRAEAVATAKAGHDDSPAARSDGFDATRGSCGSMPHRPTWSRSWSGAVGRIHRRPESAETCWWQRADW